MLNNKNFKDVPNVYIFLDKLNLLIAIFVTHISISNVYTQISKVINNYEVAISVLLALYAEEKYKKKTILLYVPTAKIITTKSVHYVENYKL